MVALGLASLRPNANSIPHLHQEKEGAPVVPD
jgi:hypothetical protein